MSEKQAETFWKSPGVSVEEHKGSSREGGEESTFF